MIAREKLWIVTNDHGRTCEFQQKKSWIGANYCKKNFDMRQMIAERNHKFQQMIMEKVAISGKQSRKKLHILASDDVK